MSSVETGGQRKYLLTRFAPGLAKLLRYQRADFESDLLPGLSIASVALPVGVAYVDLAGFNPIVGLYSSILPLVAYAIFGTSRQLIVGPDAATCALVAAVVAPLAGGNQHFYVSLSVTLALLVGIFCVGGKLSEAGSTCGFPLQTNFGGVPKRHRTEYHPRANRQDLRVHDCLRRHRAARNRVFK